MIGYSVEWPFDPQGNQYPVLRLTVDGVHDVGRVLATMARGNVEHAHVAHEVGRLLNRTPTGRATLAYLEGHGGPKLAPGPCEACEAGDHAGCYELLYPSDPVDGAVCGCLEADEVQHLLPCCIDDCTNPPVIRIESYPDNVNLCAEHRYVHGPLEDWEVAVRLERDASPADPCAVATSAQAPSNQPAPSMTTVAYGQGNDR